MKIKILLPLTAAGVMLISGCGTNAHYIQSGGHESVVSVNQINIQDFIAAANAATSDLLASGALDRVSNPPAVLAMSRIVNNTSQQIDTDLLTKKIRVALLQSGKAVTTTQLPDFTLSGKIIETFVKAGDTKQSTYSFQLSLTDKRGLAVWEGDKDITKQGTRSGVGF
jgi:PBP1b-binding outer membrane lipoprotein LpoB